MPPPQAHNVLKAQVKRHLMPNACTQGSPTVVGFQDNHLKTTVASTSTACKGKVGLSGSPCTPREALLTLPGRFSSLLAWERRHSRMSHGKDAARSLQPYGFCKAVNFPAT